MPLCFIEPQNAIRVIAESVGREARRQILGEVVKAWVDEIPEPDLESHYAKAVADLDEHDLSLLAAWHASLEVGQQALKVVAEAPQMVRDLLRQSVESAGVGLDVGGAIHHVRPRIPQEGDELLDVLGGLFHASAAGLRSRARV